MVCINSFGDCTVIHSVSQLLNRLQYYYGLIIQTQIKESSSFISINLFAMNFDAMNGNT